MSGLIKGKEVHFDDTYLHVKLQDDRIISTPIGWYEPLKKATLSQLKNYKFICLDTGIEWEDIDYHLNIDSMLRIPNVNVENTLVETNSERLSTYCREKLNLKNAKLDIGHYYSNLPLCIIDAVFSIGIRYTATRNVVERFSKYLELKTFRKFGSCFPNIKEQYSISQFIEFYQNNDNKFITEKVYENSCRTSSRNGILKSEAVFEFAKVLEQFDINYFQDVKKNYK